MIHVAWCSWAEDTPTHGYWDQAVIEALTGPPWSDEPPLHGPLGRDYRHHEGLGSLPPSEGAVVVVPARSHVALAERINDELARLPWVLLVLTGDEEHVFPLEAIDHPSLRGWAQTAHPRAVGGRWRAFGDWWPQGTREALQAALGPESGYGVPWFYAGQVNNPEREAMVAALRHRQRWRRDGDLVATPGFTLGLERSEYRRRLAMAAIAPAPPGCFTPDTFRAYEALAAGAVPIVGDTTRWDPEPGWWSTLLGDDLGWPVIEDWSSVGDHIDALLAEWPACANRAQAGYLAHKWHVRRAWDDDLTALSGEAPELSPVTILVPTSPVGSHPEASIMVESIESARAAFPGAEVVLMADGVRPEQEALRPGYEGYQRIMTWWARSWGNARLLRHWPHRHQAAMLREALAEVTTELVLFLEHDTPLVGDGHAEAMAAFADERVSLLRFHHEASVLDEHEHLMLGGVQLVGGVPARPTMQWSQRPHLARAAWYREVLDEHFGPDARCFVEDRMHGVVQEARDPASYGLWLFHPEGDVKRSTHLDARAGADKYTEAQTW